MINNNKILIRPLANAAARQVDSLLLRQQFDRFLSHNLAINKVVESNLSGGALTTWGEGKKRFKSTSAINLQSGNSPSLTPLSNFEQSVVLGLLLSDGWLSFSSRSKNARLGFKQSNDKASYVLFVYKILSNYCSSPPRLTKILALQFFTRSLPCFTALHSLFYVNKVKVLPNDIYNMLTPEALAHFIMGDGAAQNTWINSLY
jgi:LAGLIDADG DNA endonuclease family